MSKRQEEKDNCPQPNKRNLTGVMLSRNVPARVRGSCDHGRQVGLPAIHAHMGSLRAWRKIPNKQAICFPRGNQGPLFTASAQLNSLTGSHLLKASATHTKPVWTELMIWMAPPNTHCLYQWEAAATGRPLAVTSGALEDCLNTSGGADRGSVNMILISFHILFKKLLTLAFRINKICD